MITWQQKSKDAGAQWRKSNNLDYYNLIKVFKPLQDIGNFHVAFIFVCVYFLKKASESKTLQVICGRWTVSVDHYLLSVTQIRRLAC